MKQFLLFVLSFVVGIPVFSQATSGKIIYEAKVNMHKQLPPGDEQIKTVMPEFSALEVEVLYRGNLVVVKPKQAIEDARNQPDGPAKGDHMFVSVAAPLSVEIFKNYETGTVVELRELGPKKYLIKDSMPEFQWKLEGQSKTVAGFACKKATTKNKEGDEIVAWYTEAIACPGGPELYGGLPGMILELQAGDNAFVYSAKTVGPIPEKAVLTAPTKGKEMSRKAFDQMIEKEMNAPLRSGKPVRIAF